MDFKNFKVHRPVDPSDPGFTVPGVRFRWNSGRVRERSDSTGIWSLVRKNNLPKDLVEHIQNRYPGAFREGDTIRRGDSELVLAYAKTEVVQEHRKYLDSLSKDQASRAKIMPRQEHIPGGKDFAKITDYEESASSIPSQFLNKKQSE